MVSRNALRWLSVILFATSTSALAIACSGADEGDEGATGEATPASQFVPGEAPSQPPLPPGAGPRPQTPEPPKPDSGGGNRDSGSDSSSMPDTGGGTDAGED